MTERIALAGGSGQLGALLAEHYRARGADVVVLGRTERPTPGRFVAWDGRTLGPWADEIDGASLVVNLAGRSVDCRYTEENKRLMMDSRVDSTRAIGEAIAAAHAPPPLWLQMSTATIYAHTLTRDQDEATGTIGLGDEGSDPSWGHSVAIAEAWEEALASSPTPQTRKVALRAAMVMSPSEGGVFDVLRGLAKKGLGGAAASGTQYVSWVHADDFVAALDHIESSPHLEGAINIASPHPLPNRAFMAALRSALGVPIGLPAAKWMLSVGALFMRTETELLLKSRRVVPGRLLADGFTFRWPTWPEAAAALAASPA